MEHRDHVTDFSLAASTGQTLSLDSFKGKVPVVLVFLDPDQEDDLALLEQLDERHRDFGSQTTQVLAVSKITARAARELADEMDLTIPILADASGAMARDHGVERITAVVADKDGRIVERLDALADEDRSHAIDAMLTAVAGLGPEQRQPGSSG